MTPEQQTALVAERLPRAIRAAAGLKDTIISKPELAELSGEAAQLMHHINGVGLVILPVEYFSEGVSSEKEVSVKPQARQGVRAVPTPGAAKEPIVIETNPEGLRAFGNGSREEVSS